MPITIGLDLGTTTITALALDTSTGAIAATATRRNDAETTAPVDKTAGRSEWDPARIFELACLSLKDVAGQVGPRHREIVGLCLTGQQHGGLLYSRDLRPLTPLVNWQDRRGMDPLFGTGGSYVQHATHLLGSDAPRRAGCALLPGFLGVYLFWLKAHDALPHAGWAGFITEYVAARLTGAPAATDPTMAGSSGLFDVHRRDWDQDALQALGLPPDLFPPVREAGDPLGYLDRPLADALGLPSELPVLVGLGDNQASFVGSVADRAATLGVNVGTGAQVGRFVTQVYHATPLETRPFPRGGYLLVNAGLAGGRAYALLERFFRQVGQDVLGVSGEGDVYAAMNRLARQAPPGADGLRCEPYFAGGRGEPERRALWTGMTDRNFTPAHMTRALIEGMAQTLRVGYDRIVAATGATSSRLVGAGNGLRQNTLLAEAVAEAFGLPLAVPAHHEEAAYGAALVAGVGVGVWPDLDAAGQVIRYA